MKTHFLIRRPRCVRKSLATCIGILPSNVPLADASSDAVDDARLLALA
ncbi:MAG: hypothetical protein ABIP44_06105 [Pseudoxanthomonas sp.]